jgi:hypothetical protein
MTPSGVTPTGTKAMAMATPTPGKKYSCNGNIMQHYYGMN